MRWSVRWSTVVIFEAVKMKVLSRHISSKEAHMVGASLIKVGDYVVSPHTVTSVGSVTSEAYAPLGFLINHLQGTTSIVTTGVEMLPSLDANDRKIDYGFDVREAYHEFVAGEVAAFEQLRAEFLKLLDAALERKP